jgi:hypothetical protein
MSIDILNRWPQSLGCGNSFWDRLVAIDVCLWLQSFLHHWSLRTLKPPMMHRRRSCVSIVVDEITTDCRTLPRIATVCHRLPHIATDCHRLPQISTTSMNILFNTELIDTRSKHSVTSSSSTGELYVLKYESPVLTTSQPSVSTTRLRIELSRSTANSDSIWS